MLGQVQLNILNNTMKEKGITALRSAGDIKSGVGKRETMHNDPHGTRVLPDEFRMKFRYPAKVFLRIQLLNPQINSLNL